MAESPSRSRVAIFVDGANLFKSAQELRVPIDYVALKDRVVADRELVLAKYFGSFKREPTEDDERFLNAIKEAGFELVLRPLKREVFKMPRGARVEVTPTEGFSPWIYSEKGVDVALVTELLSRAWDNVYDIAVLVSADSDHLAAVRELLRHGKQVEVAAFSHNIRWEMKAAARFVDLAQILS